MKVYRLLLGDAPAHLGWRLLALFALMSLVGLGEGMSVVLLLPFLKEIGNTPETNTGDSRLHRIVCRFA